MGPKNKMKTELTFGGRGECPKVRERKLKIVAMVMGFASSD